MTSNKLQRNTANSSVKELPRFNLNQNKIEISSQIRASSNYLKIYTFLIAVSFVLIGITNFIVNPQKLFSDRNLLNLQEENTFDNWLNHARHHKANELRKGSYDTLILGNSRVFRGLDSQHPNLALYSTYNAGLPLANIYEIEKVFNYARQQSKIKKVIIGLDLGQFSGQRNLAGDFKKSRFAGEIPYLSTYFSNLFSIPKFTDSLKKIENNLQDAPINSDFKTINGFKEVDKNKNIDSRENFLEVTHNFISEQGYLNFSYSQEKLKILKKIITSARQEEIEIYLFISPVHAWQLEFMEITNIFPLFEQWKKDLVNLIAENNRQNHDKIPVLLWDFSGYNTITTESVPLDEKKEMQWYDDPSHYKKEVGDLILNQILDRNSSNNNQINNFGVLIDRHNIESHLAVMRSQKLIYQKNNVRDIKIIKDIAREQSK